VLSDLFRHSPAVGAPLKVGVLLDDFTLKRCFVSVLEDINASNFAVLDFVILHKRRPVADTRPRSRLSKGWSRLTTPKSRQTLLYDLYLRWDEKHRATALEDVSSEDVLGRVDRIDIEPVTKGFVHRFPEDAIQQISDRNLDVLLRFGFNILRGDILSAARYGVWSFHHGDNEFYRGGPAMFWELWEDNPLSGVILQKLTEDLDAGIVLCKSVFATADTNSLAENRRGPYAGTSHFVIRKLNELHRFGPAALGSITPDLQYRGRRKLYRMPTNTEMLQWIGRRVANRAARTVQRETTKHWRIGIRKGGPFLDHAVAARQPLEPAGFRWLDAPKGHAYADPFLFHRDGRLWMFAEDYEYAAGKGRIVAGEMTVNNAVPALEPCLNLSHHLSFPFVFEHEGSTYLVPESSAAHEVVLYKASNFPFQWEREKVLLSGDYVDTVIWPHAGYWWLLTTAREPRGHAVHALLFRADSPEGDWAMHPQSTLFNDVRFARNGGAPVRVGGKLYRVSQDCSREYGRALGFNEIVALNADTYTERAIAQLEPGFEPRMIGTHTYTRSGEWEAIDGCFLEHRRRV
jgi:hypothetical protein